MDYVVIHDSDELYHHGILGMKWGIRRFQNKDGTWKAAGKKRRKISPDAQARAERKNEMKNLKSKGELDTAKAAYKITKEKNKQAVKTAKAESATIGKKLKNAAKELADKRKAKKHEETVDEIVRSGDLNKVIKNKGKLSNEELNEAIRRMEMEQKLNNVSSQKKQDALNAYKRVADVVGTTANLTTNGIKIYNNVASVLNTFTDSDLMIIKTNKEGGGEAGRMVGDAARRANDAVNRASEASNRRNNSSESSSGSNSSDSRSNARRAADGFREHQAQQRSESSSTSNSSESSSDSRSTMASMPSAGARQRAQEGFRQWRESTTPPRTVVTGEGTSRRQAESTVERHARERASAVDVESRSMVENEIMPYVEDARFRRNND